MFANFGKIIEERILAAQKRGDFDNLPGKGVPLPLEDDQHIPEDLRLPYKILKNAGMAPPEIEMHKKIVQTETLLSEMKDTREKHRILKKLNFMIMRLNSMRGRAIPFEVPQQYVAGLIDRLEAKP